MKKAAKALKIPSSPAAVSFDANGAAAAAVDPGSVEDVASGTGRDLSGESHTLPKTLSNFLQKNTDAMASTLRGSLRKKKDKGLSIMNTVSKSTLTRPICDIHARSSIGHPSNS